MKSLLFLLLALLLHADEFSVQGLPSDTIESTFGSVRIYLDQGKYEWGSAVYLDEKLIFEYEEHLHRLVETRLVSTLEGKRQESIILSYGQGNGCPQMLIVLTLSKEGIKLTKPFGNCSDMYTIIEQPDSLDFLFNCLGPNHCYLEYVPYHCHFNPLTNRVTCQGNDQCSRYMNVTKTFFEPIQDPQNKERTRIIKVLCESPDDDGE